MAQIRAGGVRMAQDGTMIVGGVTSSITIFPCSGCDSRPDMLSVHCSFDFPIQDARALQHSHKTFSLAGQSQFNYSKCSNGAVNPSKHRTVGLGAEAGNSVF